MSKSNEYLYTRCSKCGVKIETVNDYIDIANSNETDEWPVYVTKCCHAEPQPIYRGDCV